MTHSRSAVSGERGRIPIWSSQNGTPRPTPGKKRPGKRRESVAHSMARSAGWRVTAEAMPRPTGSSRVAPSAAVMLANAPVKKQSSENHSSP